MKSTNTVCNEIHYAQVGEYQLPLLILSQTDDADPLGKYSRMRLAYLKISVRYCITRCYLAVLSGSICRMSRKRPVSGWNAR